MKKIILPAFIIACLLFTSVYANAQERKVVYIRAVPEWVPQQGFWVVESNAKSRLQSTIYFYTDDNVLLYKEKVEGIRLNTKKEKVKLQLKEALEKALAAYSLKQQVIENDSLVALALKNK